MEENGNGRKEYNWSYQGDDVRDYRAKYSQGFDPDYVRHAAEQEVKREEEEARRRQERAARQRAVGRRARLNAQQEIVTDRLPDRKTIQQELEEREREERSAAERSVSGRRRTVERTRPESERSASERRTAGKRTQDRNASGRNTVERTAPQSERRPSGRRSAEQRVSDSAASGRKNSAARRQQSASYRKQVLRLRYAIGAVIAVAVIFVVLLILNKHTLTISLAGMDPLYIEQGEAYDDPGATAVYKGSILHIGDKEVPVHVEQDINTNACGTYVVTYRAQYKDKEATATRTVIVPDRTAPVLTLDDTVNVVRKGDEWVDSFRATDDQDGDITDKVEVLGEVNMRRDGRYQLTYRVQDQAGNETTSTREVIVSSVAINRPETARQGDKNVIYLTFDDGPGMYTERLLEILDNHNVKATFFVTDANAASRDLIAEEYQRGHTIGVLSATNNLDLIYESGEAFWNDIDEEIRIIEEVTGYHTSFMRIPGGSSNDYIAMNDELKRTISFGIEDRGLRYYDWTIDSNDSDDELTIDDIYWNLVDQTSVADPKIALCHDLKRTTIDTIDSFLSWAIENHYVFLPITEQTPQVHHIEL